MTITPHTLASFDGIRALACLLVVSAHMTWISPLYAYGELGHLGVMLFFTLSGFLMAYHYMPGRLSLRYWCAFLVRRFLRVYPLYALVVLAVWGLAVLTTNSYLDQFTDQRIIEHLALERGSSVFWTVPVELKFYLLFSALAPLLFIAGAHLTLPILVMIWIFFSVSGLAADKTSLWPYMAFFLSGMIVARIHTQDRWLQVSDRIWALLTVACLVCIVFFGTSLYKPGTVPLTDVWAQSGFFSFVMALVLLSVSRAKGIVQTLFSHPYARFFGQISYSLYLTHFFIFILCYYYPIQRSIFSAAIILPASVVVAWVLYRTIEQPFHRAGVKLSNRIVKK